MGLELKRERFGTESCIASQPQAYRLVEAAGVDEAGREECRATGQSRRGCGRQRQSSTRSRRGRRVEAHQEKGATEVTGRDDIAQVGEEPLPQSI